MRRSSKARVGLAGALPVACVLWVAMSMGWASPAATGQAEPKKYSWPGRDATYEPTSQPSAGLDVQVITDEEQPFPRLAREIQFDVGRHIGPSTGGVETHTSRYVSPADLGMIRPVGATNPKAAPVRRNWARSLLSVQYDCPDGSPRHMEVISSRLTPAVLVHAESDLDLLAGTKYIGQYLRRQEPREDPKSSRRTPVGTTLPALCAFRQGDKVVTQTLKDLQRGLPGDLHKKWILLWYGEGSFFQSVKAAGLDLNGRPANNRTWSRYAYKADSPLLLLFDSPVRSITAEDDAVRVRFADGKGKVMIVPILGESLPPAAESGLWKDGLPEAIVKRCDWWSDHAGKYPLGVTESYRYDASTDTVTVAEQFQFAPFRDGSSFAAPVPAIVATASLEGFPIEFSTRPEDPDLVTSAGSWLAVPGVESYEIRFPGLGKYVRPRPTPAGTAPAPLLAELRDQVGRIVAAGHLAPWFPVGKNAPGWYYQRYTQDLVHGYPGEVLAALAEALGYLKPEMRRQAIEYMRRERREYPPEEISHLFGGQGARRESYAFTFSPGYLADRPPRGTANNINVMRSNNFFVRHKLIHPLAMYQLAAYYQAVGKTDLPQRWQKILAIRRPFLAAADWATGSTYQWPGQISVYSYQWGGTTLLNTSIWHGNGGVIDADYFFAASIGQIRLARLAGDAEAEQQGWGLLARSAALRFALGKMRDHLYGKGILMAPPDGPRWHSPEEDVRPVYMLDEYGMTLSNVSRNAGHTGGLIPLYGAVPEVALFAHDFLSEETGRFYKTYEEVLPDWALAWGGSALRRESNLCFPTDSYQVFLANALALDERPDWLERHLDVPWQVRGDLYYLRKLIETIRAYQRAPSPQ